MRPFSFVAIMGAIVHSRSVLADDLIGGCSSHCTHFDEESITCWNNTLAFFEEILLGQMRGYVLTEVG
jgi:hypothetical protein